MSLPLPNYNNPAVTMTDADAKAAVKREIMHRPFVIAAEKFKKQHKLSFTEDDFKDTSKFAFFIHQPGDFARIEYIGGANASQ